jgi:Flp pilus assembly protein TadG
MWRARKIKQRRGATVLEMSITLMAFLLVTLGMLDLAVGVFRHHTLSQAARYGARKAAVHGSQADRLGPWGPAAIDVAANSAGVPLVAEVAPRLIGCDLEETRVRAEWLDGDNEFSSRVRVTVTSPYEPLLAWIIPGGEVDLTAASTMQIAH